MSRGLLTIDLGAIVRNWRKLCAIHASGAVAGVVKANAYGLGAGPVATALRDAGCRHFFVAQPREGIALRKVLGPEPMIAVLGGFPRARRHGLTPVLNSLEELRAHQGQAILQVDTGMSRLGLDASELESLARDPSPLEGTELLYVMTHLAAADEPGHPLNAVQADRFAEACLKLPRARRSFANSSGIFLGGRYASDLARPGCALYGINPTPGKPNPMEPVVRLEVPVLQLRTIAAGQTVGYGGTWMAARPSRIATIAAGYADGLPRAIDGRAKGVIRGKAVPMVGRVSMDLITLDVTDAPGAAVGDLVEIIGPAQDADALARICGTIGYEILTSLGNRYERRYLPA
ncbi:alanine racemase [Roseococcus sp. SYP-B2431]|uniref:alanine racemase n=1 Tax=Roseococcus sp. SYP-B2431 TaxID=2496640 RepID=UPI0010395D45|nr:alanine racemase [Roseococcus sp. SYP-B2431]TCH96765.1 alanine racemase [Roseococcus sp. SYP-B2431]